MCKFNSVDYCKCDELLKFALSRFLSQKTQMQWAALMSQFKLCVCLCVFKGCTLLCIGVRLHYNFRCFVIFSFSFTYVYCRTLEF